MKKTAIAALIALAGTAAHAAPVPGLSDVTDNGGGSYTFIFDSVKADIDGTGMGLFFTGGGIDIIATSAQGIVRQDYPGNGGLGVLGRNGGTDNLELGLGETLNLNFSRAVDIVGWTLNGLLSKNGHQDAADGFFGVNTDGSFQGTLDATRWDGVGSDTVPGSFLSVCGVDVNYCDVEDFTLVAPKLGTPFKGYLESITIQVAPVPVPAALPLMLGAIGGLAFAARKRRRAT
ncbi:MAG: VPLPA-CTERM sorting domain-containing protein [Arenibacterium sp.]